MPRVYRSTDAFSLFFSLQVSKITPGITYKRSITTITRNPYRSPTSVGSCSKVLIPDGQRREKTLDIVQNIRRSLHLRGSTTQKAVILPQTIVFSKSSRGPSVRQAAHLHISLETTRISRECPEDFFKTCKNFSRELFQSEDDKIAAQNCPKIDTYIKRKISVSLIF